MSEQLAHAILSLAESQRDVAVAVRRNTELTELLWRHLKPAQRAKLLGVSRGTELRRRQQAEADARMKGGRG